MSKLGLALGGGGARGLAHIGVINVLEKENIAISAITGCSMGTIIGGMYAYLGSIKEVEEFIIENLNRDKFKKYGFDRIYDNQDENFKNYLSSFWDFIKMRLKVVKALQHTSFFDEETTEEMFSIFPDVPIESLKIKFSAVATDLITGQEIHFTKGSLRDIIKASAAIPGIFPPVKIGNRLLVDGSASESVPAAKVKELGVDRVLGVDVTRCILQIEPPDNIIELLYRTEDITSFHLSQVRLEEADLILRPNVRHISWIEFRNAKEIISAGAEATKQSLADIRKLIDKKAYIFELEKQLERIKKGLNN